MIEITKEQMYELIDKGILKIRNDGKYQDLMVICNKKKAKRKKRYVPHTIAKHLNMEG